MEEVQINDLRIIKKNHLLIIAIIIALIILIAMISVPTYLFVSKQKTPIDQNPSSPSIQNKIEECSVPSPSQECLLFFSTPKLDAKCQTLQEQKAQCLYNFATINIRYDICEKIEELETKNKCKEELESSFVSDE